MWRRFSFHQAGISCAPDSMLLPPHLWEDPVSVPSTATCQVIEDNKMISHKLSLLLAEETIFLVWVPVFCLPLALWLLHFFLVDCKPARSSIAASSLHWRAPNWIQYPRYSLTNTPKKQIPSLSLLPTACSWHLSPQEHTAGPRSARCLTHRGLSCQIAFQAASSPLVCARAPLCLAVGLPIRFRILWAFCQPVPLAWGGPPEEQPCLPAYQLLLPVRRCPQTGWQCVPSSRPCLSLMHKIASGLAVRNATSCQVDLVLLIKNFCVWQSSQLSIHLSKPHLTILAERTLEKLYRKPH